VRPSARWETADRKYLEAAFKAAAVDYDIQNAQNDKQAFQTIADQMITGGATVLLIVNLDSGTGKAVIDKARSQGVGVIDYDRLTLNGGASYYVSFDNEAVGKLQGEGLVKCLTRHGRRRKPVVAELNGSPTDNNATLFKDGLRLGAQAEVRREVTTPRVRTSPCRSGTTPPPAPSSSR
jgi:D-xylose transport system substrate-binding protein